MFPIFGHVSLSFAVVFVICALQPGFHIFIVSTNNMMLPPVGVNSCGQVLIALDSWLRHGAHSLLTNGINGQRPLTREPTSEMDDSDWTLVCTKTQSSVSDKMTECSFRKWLKQPLAGGFFFSHFSPSVMVFLQFSHDPGCLFFVLYFFIAPSRVHLGGFQRQVDKLSNRKMITSFLSPAPSFVARSAERSWFSEQIWS